MPFKKNTEERQKKTKRRMISINQQRKKLKKIIASPAFKTLTIINENFTSIYMEKTTVTLNNVYAGVSILDISKSHMYSFHYDVVNSVYGEKACLLQRY